MSGLKKMLGFGAPAASTVYKTNTVKQATAVSRMPTDQDTSVLDAARRQRSAAGRRKGRASTIMTDNLGGMTGSSGKTLGA